MLQVGETEIAVVKRSGDRVYHCTLKFPSNITMQDAVALHELMDGLTGRGMHVIVFDLDQLLGMDRETREFLVGTQEKDPNIIACGLVSNSPVSRIIAKLILSINRPPFPIKMYSDVAEADGWVRKKLREWKADNGEESASSAA